MKTIAKIKYVLFIAVIAAFVSCQGDAGPSGADGIDGINGTDGADGQDGNANVTASSWITPTWSVTKTYGEFAYDEAAVTTNFMNTGVILSYTDWTGLGSFIYALPYSFQDGGTVSINFNMQGGQIKWWFATDHNYTPNSGTKLRYVIPSSNTNKSANPQQEILYNLDKKAYHIQSAITFLVIKVAKFLGF
ncbi:MAG: collagen-like protein [Chlorobi bacterium]|nr:collagen-like protein [Chlorobiota bacterium]